MTLIWIKREFVVELEEVGGCLQWVAHRSGQHRTYRMQPVLERGDHPEVASAAP